MVRLPQILLPLMQFLYDAHRAVQRLTSMTSVVCKHELHWAILTAVPAAALEYASNSEKHLLSWPCRANLCAFSQVL